MLTVTSASASKSALLLSPCLSWAVEGAREYRDENADTTKRDKGSLFHKGMDIYYRGGYNARSKIVANDRVCGDSQVLEWVNVAQTWSIGHLEPRCVKIRSEVYVATNFATGSVHTDNRVHDRKYPKKPGFLPGTADLVCVLADGGLLVADWKTGSGTGADKQLLSLAVGLQQTFKRPDGGLRPVTLMVLYAGDTDDGCVHPVEWAVTDSDLQAHQHAMAGRLALINAATQPVVGIHCTQLYCPHLAYCKGVGEIMSDMAQKSLPVVQNLHTITDQPISDEEAGYTMERIYAAKRQYEYLMSGIKKYIDGGGRAVSGEFEYKKTTTGFRWVKNGK